LVTSEVLCPERIREIVVASTDDGKCRLELVLVEEFQEPGSLGTGTIIKSQTPGALVRAGKDIGVARASTTRPPAAGRISRGLGVSRATTWDGGWDIGDVVSLEFF